MFSYYGSKSKIVNLYPPPKYSKIIEPFAGSARYSLKYWQKDVLLMDKYDKIVELWKWLQKCSPNDILSLPDVEPGDEIPLSLSQPEYDFVSYNLHRGRAVPSKKAGKFSDCWHTTKKRVSKDLFKIKHWTIQLGTYDEIPNFPDVTWFIDPPYEKGGEYYLFSSKQLDFEHLGRWCMNRTGQVIVCENTKATWLPFKPLRKIQGSANTDTTEVIWSNLKTNYDNVQMGLF